MLSFVMGYQRVEFRIFLSAQMALQSIGDIRVFVDWAPELRNFRSHAVLKVANVDLVRFFGTRRPFSKSVSRFAGRRREGGGRGLQCQA